MQETNQRTHKLFSFLRIEKSLIKKEKIWSIFIAWLSTAVLGYVPPNCAFGKNPLCGDEINFYLFKKRLPPYKTWELCVINLLSIMIFLFICFFLCFSWETVWVYWRYAVDFSLFKLSFYKESLGVLLYFLAQARKYKKNLITININLSYDKPSCIKL